MVVGTVCITIILIHDFVEGELFLDVALHINNNKIKQMTLATVYTYYMRIVCLLQIFPYFLVDILRTNALEVHSDWHMKQELVNCVTTILDEVVFKHTLLLLVILVLVLNRMVSRVSRMGIVDTLLAIEHLSLSIKFVNYICQITFIKQCFPIKSMHIWSALAILREILIVDLEQIHLSLLNKLINK